MFAALLPSTADTPGPQGAPCLEGHGGSVGAVTCEFQPEPSAVLPFENQPFARACADHWDATSFNRLTKSLCLPLISGWTWDSWAF